MSYTESGEETEKQGTTKYKSNIVQGFQRKNEWGKLFVFSLSQTI